MKATPSTRVRRRGGSPLGESEDEVLINGGIRSGYDQSLTRGTETVKKGLFFWKRMNQKQHNNFFLPHKKERTESNKLCGIIGCF